MVLFSRSTDERTDTMREISDQLFDRIWWVSSKKYRA